MACDPLNFSRRDTATQYDVQNRFALVSALLSALQVAVASLARQTPLRVGAPLQDDGFHCPSCHLAIWPRARSSMKPPGVWEPVPPPPRLAASSVDNTACRRTCTDPFSDPSVDPWQRSPEACKLPHTRLPENDPWAPYFSHLRHRLENATWEPLPDKHPEFQHPCTRAANEGCASVPLALLERRGRREARLALAIKARSTSSDLSGDAYPKHESVIHSRAPPSAAIVHAKSFFFAKVLNGLFGSRLRGGLHGLFCWFAEERFNDHFDGVDDDDGFSEGPRTRTQSLEQFLDESFEETLFQAEEEHRRRRAERQASKLALQAPPQPQSFILPCTLEVGTPH